MAVAGTFFPHAEGDRTGTEPAACRGIRGPAMSQESELPSGAL